MTEKQRAVEKARMESAEKWAKYLADGGELTPEIMKQMAGERETISKLAREATKEWLEEKKKGKANG